MRREGPGGGSGGVGRCHRQDKIYQVKDVVGEDISGSDFGEDIGVWHDDLRRITLSMFLQRPHRRRHYMGEERRFL